MKKECKIRHRRRRVCKADAVAFKPDRRADTRRETDDRRRRVLRRYYSSDIGVPRGVARGAESAIGQSYPSLCERTVFHGKDNVIEELVHTVRKMTLTAQEGTRSMKQQYDVMGMTARLPGGSGTPCIKSPAPTMCKWLTEAACGSR